MSSVEVFLAIETPNCSIMANSPSEKPSIEETLNFLSFKAMESAKQTEKFVKICLLHSEEVTQKIYEKCWKKQKPSPWKNDLILKCKFVTVEVYIVTYNFLVLLDSCYNQKKDS